MEETSESDIFAVYASAEVITLLTLSLFRVPVYSLKVWRDYLEDLKISEIIVVIIRPIQTRGYMLTRKTWKITSET